MSASVTESVAAFLSLVAHDRDDPANAVFSDDVLAKVLEAAIQLYSKRVQTTGFYSPPATNEISATDVLTFVSELIRMANLNVFDVSMWLSRPR